jgi:hypothetical protein
MPVNTYTRRLPSTYSTAIQQSTTTGKHFTGAQINADSPLQLGGIYKYAALAADGGGLFYWDANEPLVCGQFHCDLGGSADFHLYLVNLDPTSVRAWLLDTTTPPTIVDAIKIEEQTGASFVALDEARFKTVLLPYQALQLVTSASAGAQFAQAVASIERTYIR